MQINKWLYRHSLKCINYLKDNIVDYLDQSLNQNAYCMTYTSRIKPMSDELSWRKVENMEALKPPIVKKKISRPMLTRRREISESIIGKEV